MTETVVRLTLFALPVFATLVGAPHVAHADDVNWGIASEFGRGVGLGVERDIDLVLDNETLVIGAGVVGSFGQSSSAGTLYTVEPGVAIGYRKYLAGWFIGPSLGLNATVATTGDSRGRFTASAMLDVGHRWSIGEWNIRVGLSGGYAANTKGATGETFGLTLSVGR